MNEQKISNTNANENTYINSEPITTEPIKGIKKPVIKPFIDKPPNGEGTRNKPLGSEELGNPIGCGPDHFGKWLMACSRC
ncbi:uncharacterized protein I206_104725 [Kwoniella pini CBS 10737]|uniref:Uncharacterized protein n=1 Tax=Kwoniella pini CBS 10737 TaxID=1296096 RepID=A0A1B9I7T7_9TREE|nr:uncharacterized protein I206_02263 [Kwoniella pini CBS 10737]OCF51549.1 hypothetical protein I206_02263 [Kwoniella pini CBS 10737]